MSSPTIVDRKTLAWIKEGVDETLKSVHHAPDDFLENVDDTSPIEACIEPLHRVKGAVEMVGIQGAAMVAEEMEHVARAVVENRVKQKTDAAEVLASGMLQLPGYLESLYYGQPDIPLILLPLLNDLRACQDKELLTEGEFFRAVLYTLTVFDFVIVFNQYQKLLGTDVMFLYAYGKYQAPEYEDRIFMFLDLSSSTEMAESMEPDKYFGFIIL